MAGARIEIDPAQMADIRDTLAEIKNGAEKAMRMSLNRTADGAKVIVAGELLKALYMSSSDIKSYILVKKASINYLSAKVSVSGRLIPGMAFKNTPSLTQYYANGPQPGGIMQNVLKSGGGFQMKHAFYGLSPKGDFWIYERKWDAGTGKAVKRVPLTKLMTAGMSWWYQKVPGISQTVEEGSADRLLRELARNVQYLLDKQADKITDV